MIHGERSWDGPIRTCRRAVGPLIFQSLKPVTPLLPTHSMRIRLSRFGLSAALVSSFVVMGSAPSVSVGVAAAPSYPPLFPHAAVADSVARVSEIFAAFDSASSPGCAVAVSREGQVIVRRAFGMADLEHGIANEPGTIFEAGSVAKQFTAAAVVLLALDGHLSLDDDVRQWIPEVPDYGEPITIHQMLTHTAGLRDWGSVAAISGWGRSQRSHTHEHVLDIVSRQTALNYRPGESYSYSNTGYNLAAVLVERITGMSFADFSRERIFEPLGLEDTQWRADYRQVVPGRAAAYAPSENGFHIDRPIEFVHGNGGLLTTVSDLLAWNEHLRTGTMGEEFMAMMHRRAVLNDGTEIHYAGGLQFGEQNGVQQISHTGATSGYRAYLSLFPDEELSVALLCNSSSANPGGLGGRVAAVFLPEPPASSEADDDEATTSNEEGSDGQAPSPPAFEPSAHDLAAFAGVYHSDDAETTLEVAVEEGELMVLRRPSTRMTLRPGSDVDAFNGPLGQLVFIRDESGEVREISLRQARVHDLRFHRVDP
ncbi:MAG: class A beta-lactamase-related serine hydrolase [Gemmatimonadales bacterium]|nr:MAG: class A beta-lactamase-related serine hydrolase [Gemmatimonadales bacterium]